MGAYKVLALMAIVATMSQVATAMICAGCPIKQDPDKFPMHKLSAALATAQVNDVAAKILSVTVQVVSGAKYTVTYQSASGKVCTASWVDAPWESELPLDSQVSCKAKRSLGGFEDVEESLLPELEEFGNQAVNAQVNGFRKVILKVLEAQKQVVNGMMYKVKYLVKTTSCQMEEVPENTCMEKETAPREVCSATLFTSPYLTLGGPQTQVLNIECTNSMTQNLLAVPASGIVTGHDEKDLVRAEMFAVKGVNDRLNSLNYKGLYKVLNVEKKMEAGGNMYTIEFELRDTDCNKGEESTKECHFVKNTADLKCKSKVWFWPWTGLMKTISSECH